MKYRLVTNGIEVKMQGKSGFFKPWKDIKEAKAINPGNATTMELAEMFLVNLSSKKEWVIFRGPYTDKINRR